MTRLNVRSALLFGLLATGSSIALTACDDAFGPVDWALLTNADSVTLFSLARTEHFTEPSAFDLHSLNAIVIENAGVPAFSYDFVLSEDDTGAFVFLPTGYFPDAPVRPGLILDDTASFDGLHTAPRDGYEQEAPVSVEVGGVYVVRSRSANGCTRFGKLEVLAANADGTVEFRVLRNPNCSDRNLVPTVEPEEEDGEAGGEG